MRTLEAGPFIGEFGWELMRWQAYLRAMSRTYGHTRVISRLDRAFLYEDFADEFTGCDPGTLDGNMYSAWGLPSYNIGELGGKKDRIAPRTKAAAEEDFNGVKPEFIRYGKVDDSIDSPCFLIHARQLKSRWPQKEARSWSAERWAPVVKSLLEMGFYVSAIGHPDQSFCPDGARDLRGVPLSLLANLMATAKGIVGPSSGPMHFAALCGCRQFVWIGDDPNGRLEKRYKFDWNPFGIPVHIISAEGRDWNPESEQINLEIKEALA